ncbi:MAG: tRNA (adenosine(37)-N6)-threonylcarbamoyltransferase complex ATPase subunit type 1 TsaE [Phycisphaerae bacterium]|nr:tRNA (adenosine(37)-N6)-threonylcarbamoyltransferase complex ATPase subunit type 1 TsaE [Phycisphaerae bacterium]
MVIRSDGPERTLALGEALAALLRPGDVIGLAGPLGSGKTCLVKGLARGMRVPPDEPVVSPTFVLAREHAGVLPLCHIDAYRLAASEELASLGFEERREQGAVVVIEWADRFVGLLPPETIWIELDHGDAPDARRITVRWGDEKRAAALAASIGAVAGRE